MRADIFTAFELETVQCDSHVELRVSGELDIGTGLHELVVAYKAQQAAGAELVLQAPAAQTRRVLEIVGLDRLFPIR